MDLRYVPDDTVFSNKPRDTATSAPTVYQKQDFVTRALQHSNVKLTWDEDDDDRVKVTRRAFTKDELKDMDFKAYLASSSSEEEEEDEEDNDDDAAAGHRGVGTASSDSGSDEDDSSSRKKKRAARNKYQSLLSSIGKGSNNPFAKHSSLNENTLVNSDSDNDIDSDEDVQGDMEITFTPGLSEAASKALDRKREKEMLSKETVFETKVRQMKEKKKAKRNLSNAAVNGDDDGKKSGKMRKRTVVYYFLT